MPRRRWSLAGAVVVCALVTGCAAASTPDPALVALVGESLSAARTAELDLGLVQDDRTLPTTGDVVLSDMVDALATAGRELELHTASGPRDDAYRDAALDAVRDALGGIRSAREGDPATGLRAVGEAADALAGLDAAGGRS